MAAHEQTIATYDQSPEEFAEMFRGIGSRKADVDRAFELAGNPTDARVVEIGCGDGRDAEEITKHTPNYVGIDPSKGLLKLARLRQLSGTFVESDALSFEYPQQLDIAFAFASLLHVTKEDLALVFSKLHASLRDAGIAYVSLKERDSYQTELQHDEFGDRLFYYYDVPTVEKAAGSGFQTIYEAHQLIGKTNWFELALQKI